MTKEQLIQQIKSAIRTNGAQEITGVILQGALVNLVETLYEEIDGVSAGESLDSSELIVQTLGSRTDVAVSQKVTSDVVREVNNRLNALAGLVTKPIESYVLEIEGVLDIADNVQNAQSIITGSVYFANKAILQNGSVLTDCFVLRNGNGFFIDWFVSDTDNSSIYGTFIEGKLVPKADKIFKDMGSGKLYVFSPESGDLKALNDLASVFRTTYASLKNLVDAGQLVPGARYRITDFVTTCPEGMTAFSKNVMSAGHAFDLIVTANSATELNAKASACLREGDTYFASSRLGDWELKYDINNDSARYKWADPAGKGVIYFMRDEFGNEAPYDFKNILFDGIYTFNYSPNTTQRVDFSLRGDLCYGNIIRGYYEGSKLALNNITHQSNSSTNGYIRNNTYGTNCHSIELGGNCNGNKFGNNCTDIVFRGNDNSITLGDNCSHITLMTYIYYVNLGIYCAYLTLQGTATTSSSDRIRYVNVSKGVFGTAEAPLTISLPVNTRHQTTVAKNSAGAIKVYNEADLVQ